MGSIPGQELRSCMLQGAARKIKKNEDLGLYPLPGEPYMRHSEDIPREKETLKSVNKGKNL